MSFVPDGDLVLQVRLVLGEGVANIPHKVFSDNCSLMPGICNGFQALIYGEYIDPMTREGSTSESSTAVQDWCVRSFALGTVSDFSDSCN